MRRNNEKARFPEILKRPNATVRIYEVKNRDRVHYCVSYISPSGRVRRNFANYIEARREADKALETIARGDVEGLKLTGRDRHEYALAKQAIAHTGFALDQLARDYAAAFKILGDGGSILEAVRYYKATAIADLPPISVSEAVEKFKAAKAAEGLSALYIKDIRLILGRLASHFSCNIGSVYTEDLRSYLNGIPNSAVSKNNHRRLIVALFNFARSEGWLPSDAATAADGLRSYKVTNAGVVIYTPQELARLLAVADYDFLPYIVLIAFGGIRREELRKGLAWDTIDFVRQSILVPASIAKTNRKRKIVMATNLEAWLEPYRGSTGPIFTSDPRRRMEKLTRLSGVPWRRNALRHSFGSYRMEQTKNAGQVALEMGNSPSVVMEHYFEIVDARDAHEYWSIAPSNSVRNIVRFAS